MWWGKKKQTPVADCIMYIPSAFEMKDPAEIAEAISADGFATVVSQDGDSLFASHLPFLYKPGQGVNGKLVSHMARANNHWRLFGAKREVLVIFNGPHAYISPNWYVSPVAVPTWNYVTVHVYGIPRIMASDAELDAVLNETVEKYESGFISPWTPNLPADLKAKLHQAIVGFEIEITRIEAKFKLGQNRSNEDQAKMIQALENSGNAEAVRLAALMRRGQ
jgi:transcriptional regulator